MKAAGCRKWIILALWVIPFLLMTTAGHAGDAETDKTDPPWDNGFTEPIIKGFSFHKPNYALPATWSNIATHSEDSEFIFQISGKLRLFDTGLYAAYTQKSFWRILDGEDSRPFRETNYNPELFYRLLWEKNTETDSKKDPLAWGCDLGFEHESNGSREPTSRSWNRLYAIPFVKYKNQKYGKLRADFKVWYRIPEDDKESEEDTSGDENPDINDYYGYGQLNLRYEFVGPSLLNEHMVHLMGRYNTKTRNGCGQLQYSLPLFSKNFFVFFQLFSGYGESLIDYNNNITRYGVGVMLRR